MLNNLPVFCLKRKYLGNNGTIGSIFDIKNNLICHTLERPKEFEGKENVSDNQATKVNESCCVPEGDYLVLWTWSSRFQKRTFELKNVFNRDGIRIHASNHIGQILGCIAPATKILENIPDSKDSKIIYPVWASESKKALANLESVFSKNGVILKIREEKAF